MDEADITVLCSELNGSFSGGDLIECCKSEDMINKCFEYNNVSICLIDIVGFSNWCSKHTARDVVKMMIEYNNNVNVVLKKFKLLTKIELVGDSCLIVGGMDKYRRSFDDVVTQEKHTLEMIQFCKALIDTDMFGSVENLSLRIGVHIGDVFATFMNNPFKFQMYGNDINTTSRLESSSYPGVIHVSDKVMTILDKHPKLGELNYGLLSTKALKGINDIDSAYLTKITPHVLVVDDMRICQLIIGRYLKNYTVEYCSDLEKGVDMLKSKIYEHVLLDTRSETCVIFDRFRQFRVWETKHRAQSQNVIAVTANPDLSKEDEVLFDCVVDKSNIRTLADVLSCRRHSFATKNNNILKKISLTTTKPISNMLGFVKSFIFRKRNTNKK